METGLRHFLEGVKNVIFPPRCLACGASPTARPDVHFCRDCLASIKYVRSPLCACCGAPIPHAHGDDHRCSHCLRDMFHFTKARSVLAYSDPLAKALYALKYGGSGAGLATFGVLFEESPARLDLEEPDIVMPVPLHPRRLRERGFNQSISLAKALFPHMKERLCTDLLNRSRATTSQTGLDRSARKKNVWKAFLMRDKERVRGRKVLLVDDVFTTGATASECARVLVKCGASRVEVLTLVRVVFDGLQQASGIAIPLPGGDGTPD